MKSTDDIAIVRAVRRHGYGTRSLRRDIRLSRSADDVVVTDPYRLVDGRTAISPAAFALATSLGSRRDRERVLRAYPELSSLDESDIDEFVASLDEQGLFEGTRAERIREQAIRTRATDRLVMASLPGTSERIADQCTNLLERARRRIRVDEQRGRIVGALVPHGDLSVTGDCSAAAYGHLDRDGWPDVFVILATSHYSPTPTLLGRDVFTPLGRIRCDRDLTRSLQLRCGPGVAMDAPDLLVDHSWQVDLPLLQVAAEQCGRSLTICVMLTGVIALENGARLGEALSDALCEQGLRAFVAASGDLTHVGSGYPWQPPYPLAGKTIASVRQAVREDEAGSLDAIRRRDVRGFVRGAKRSSFCGRSQVAAMLACVDGRGEILEHVQVLNGKRLRGAEERRWAPNDRLFSAASVAFFDGVRPAPLSMCRDVLISPRGKLLHRCLGEPLEVSEEAIPIYRELQRGADSIDDLKRRLEQRGHRFGRALLDEFVRVVDSAGLGRHPEPNVRSNRDAARTMLALCRERVPAYAGYPEEFESAPVINASCVKRDWESYFARGVKRTGVTLRQTSGSTGGAPLVSVVEREIETRRTMSIGSIAVRYGNQRRFAINRPGNLDLSWTPAKRIARRKHALGVAVTPGPDPSAVDGATWDAIIGELISSRASVVSGDPAYLAGLARRISARGVVLDEVRDVVSGHAFCWSLYRRAIERGFRLPVDVALATSEFGPLARTCREGAMHLIETSAYLEILRDGRAVEVGEAGALVVTTLDSRLRPIVRYATGDVVRYVAEACRCGRPFRLIEFEGRIRDLVPDRDGRPMTYRDLDALIDAPNGLDYFSLSESDSAWSLTWVGAPEVFDARALCSRLAARLGRPVRPHRRQAIGVSQGKLLALRTSDRSLDGYAKYLGDRNGCVPPAATSRHAATRRGR